MLDVFFFPVFQGSARFLSHRLEENVLTTDDWIDDGWCRIFSPTLNFTFKRCLALQVILVSGCVANDLQVMRMSKEI